MMGRAEVFLEAKNVRKRFKLYASPRDRLVEWLSLGKEMRHKEFWVLDDICLTIKMGTSLGLIGQNGSGKSTLLRVLSRALSPTSGTVDHYGRILALISLGTGFNRSLSGRENIPLVGQMLGFDPVYIRDRTEDIIAFSELGEFIDQPVRIYSSGMGARLGFALFVFLEPDVLMLDEILSVGDEKFRNKSMGVIEEKVRREDRSAVIVSHSSGMLSRLCDLVAWIHHGKIIEIGPPAEVLRSYQKSFS